MELNQRVFQEAARLVEEGRHSDAKWFMEQVAIDLLNHLGSFYTKHHIRPELAAECLKMAKRIDPGNHVVRSNLAHILNNQDRFQEAAPEAIQGVRLSREEVPGTLLNCAIVMNNCQRTDEAIHYYRRCLEIEDDATTRYNLGCCLLYNGEYAEGWKYYESRLAAFEKTIRFETRWEHPRWDGSPLDGKSIAVYIEQGVGDLVHFVRYVPELFRKGAGEITIEVQEDIHELLAYNLEGVNVVPRGHENYPDPPEADFCTSVCSLPFLLGIDDPEKVSGRPYLRPTNRKPPRCLEEKQGKFRVGVCWAGNPSHGHDYMRSCSIKQFYAIRDVPNVEFFSLQKDTWPIRTWKNKDVDVSRGKEGFQMTDLSPFLKTFADTAICLANLDLVITIDSAVAHLAGAMGVPCWMMIPPIPDWRWLKRMPSSTIWYDSMKLYRQESIYDWPGVMSRIRHDLTLAAN